MDSLGRRLLRGICVEKSMEVLLEKGIVDDFVFDEARIGFVWIQKYVEDYDSFPTVKMVEETIGQELPDDSEPLVYVAELIRKRRLAKHLDKNLRNAIDKIEKRDPDLALDGLLDGLIDLRGAASARPKIYEYRKRGMERFDDYQERKKSSGLLGYPTPWDNLDRNIQGWVNGGLHVIAGMTNVGKTWVLCICAEDVERNCGAKVLFVSLEMSTDRINRRFDCIRHKVPFGDLRDCGLDSVGEDEWKKKLSLDKTGVSLGTDILVADKQLVQSVHDVVMLVNEHKPGIVFIDGGYRFEERSGFGSWEKTVNIVNQLQKYAEKTDIPWIVSTQFGDSHETGKEKAKGPHVRAWNVRYGKEWLINPDVLIGIYQDEDLRLIEQMEIHTLKVRDADKSFGTFTINWGPSKTEFDEIDDDDVVTGASIAEGHEITF